MVDMSKQHEVNFPVFYGTTSTLALIRNVESNLELSVKEQILLHLAETPLFNPKSNFNALNSRSEMNVPSDPESIRALAV